MDFIIYFFTITFYKRNKPLEGVCYSDFIARVGECSLAQCKTEAEGKPR